jgi:diguanylate cyclase (GGDEF)-like protein
MTIGKKSRNASSSDNFDPVKATPDGNIEWHLSEILSEFAHTMLTDFPIQAILDHLVQRIVEVLPVTGAGVTLITSTTVPRYVAASDGLALAYEELQTELAEGPCVVAYRTGKPVAISDLREEERFSSFASRAMEAGLCAVFTFPLCQDERRLGALDLYRATPGPLNDQAMAAAQTLADVAAAYLVNAQARSDLIDSSARSHAVSLHDALAGLPNRVLLLERIEHELLVRRRTRKHVAVFFIDLDGFKAVNDNHSHELGDDLLVAVAERLSSHLRPGDTLARLSGDEFVIVCPDLNEEGEVDGIGVRLDESMSQPFTLDAVTLTLSASIGIAFADSADSPEQLLHNADVAMYQVKHKGGGSHQVIDELERDLSEYNDSLQSDLQFAIARHELRLEYQPVVRVRDGRVLSVEALLRWDHPDRGPISPSILIPFAEESGDIIAIGEWVLEQACSDRHRWENSTGGEPFVMGVNVSAHQLMAPGFVAMVHNVMVRTGTSPSQLCLEITESAFVQDAQRALDVLSQLKESGVLVALDDFGTGYSSLTYLMDFPVDILKIDQSFISKLTDHGASYAIISKTIELAHLLGLLVVCEGVETTKQNLFVAALTSDFCQGYLFSRPMTAAMLDDSIGIDESAWSISV